MRITIFPRESILIR